MADSGTMVVAVELTAWPVEASRSEPEGDERGYYALLGETIEKVRDRLNPRLQVDGILATMYDSRTLHSREVVARVHEAFGDTLLQTVIGRTVKFPDASVAAEPITTYAASHSGAYAYRLLARELIARGDAA